ncbi:MAG: ATP synthase F1 subunit delta [Acidobacteriota bacterium]
MANRTLAVRYARALAETLRRADDLVAAHAELGAAGDVLATPEARQTIGSAVLPGSRRRELTERVFAAIGFTPVVKRLIALLAESNHLGLLEDVTQAVGEICDQRRDIVAAEMTTAVELTDEMRESYRKSLEKTTGHSVRLTTRVDAAILGGAVTRMGAQVFDGSVRGQFERLHRRLKGE